MGKMQLIRVASTTLIAAAAFAVTTPASAARIQVNYHRGGSWHAASGESKKVVATSSRFAGFGSYGFGGRNFVAPSPVFRGPVFGAPHGFGRPPVVRPGFGHIGPLTGNDWRPGEHFGGDHGGAVDSPALAASVPELSAAGAGAASLVLFGLAMMLVDRRRRSPTPA